MNPAAALLPASMEFIERDWLSSNQMLFVDGDQATLIDSGYAKHEALTVALVAERLARRPGARLTRLLNTHLHSDHCGANAALARAHGCTIHVPASLFDAVARWDRRMMTHESTNQPCARFQAQGAIAPGSELTLGGAQWRALAAPGHDPNSLIFYCAEHQLLISADAFWENGFGVIFPELDGDSGFAEQHAILELIAALPVACVLPGHGRMFTDVADALERARSRLRAMREQPQRHARNALKALTKFQLLDQETQTIEQLQAWAASASVMGNAAAILGQPLSQALSRCIDELVAQAQLRRDGDRLYNA